MSQLSSTLFGGSAAVRTDGQRNNNARTATLPSGEATGNFSQMLRGYEQPVQAAPAPAPVATNTSNAPKAPEQPKPAAQQATQQQTRSETQRQEARMNARRPAAEAPKAPAAPETPNAAKPAELAKTDADEASSATPEEQEDAKLAATDIQPAALPLANPVAAASLTPAGPLTLNLALLQAQAAPAEDAAARTDAEADAPAPVDSRSRGHGRAELLARAPLADAKADAAQAKAAVSADFARELNQATLPQALKAATPARAEGASMEALLSAQAPLNGELRGNAAPASPERVVLAQPLFDPGFASEMSARLSVLAADGVQEAQLHLNPAEMGPVAVQIVVEGQQAQISFHAEQADTRAVLEQSLPDLAAALRDAGLTLSGGGVFQQAKDQDQSARQGAGGRTLQGSSQDSEPAPARAPIAPRISRGVVDLYA